MLNPPCMDIASCVFASPSRKRGGTFEHRHWWIKWDAIECTATIPAVFDMFSSSFLLTDFAMYADKISRV